jgi:hypothetical protein
METADSASVVRTSTHITDPYDHAIQLIDTSNQIASGEPTPSTVPPDSPGASSLAKTPTKERLGVRGNLRADLARKKYARFQEDRYENGSPGTAENDNSDKSRESSPGGLGARRSPKGRLRDRVPFRHRRPISLRKEAETEVDILYENQRGSFFCGIPLYSSRSLLNFDPAAWTTQYYHESPCNITNAQVPDPSWQWAWKTWYVDMSRDVDEEGWEYSFSFRQGFSWHGTHPWFHSFVRRRRWLRKRVRKDGATSAKRTSIEAHRLNADYFTIHAATRERSRESSMSRSNHRSSYTNIPSRLSGDEDDSKDSGIADIASLLKALHYSTVDRKKIAIILDFIAHGGDELTYLATNMEEIMGMFMYQTSRRQLITELLHAAEQSAADKDKDSKHAQTLVDAAEAAENNIKTLEYWSDIRGIAIAQQSHSPHGQTDLENPISLLPSDPATRAELLEFGLTSPNPDFYPSAASETGEGDSLYASAASQVSGGSAVTIRGIPKEAGLDEEPSIVPEWAKQGPSGSVEAGKDSKEKDAVMGGGKWEEHECDLEDGDDGDDESEDRCGEWGNDTGKGKEKEKV